MPDQNPILLQTKLHRPSLPPNLTERTRLIEQLNSGFHRPLTLVVAAAGFGKTTLVSTWLGRTAGSKSPQASTLPSAWLSLDENDSDLNFFIRYCIAAVRSIYPDTCAETELLLNASQQPPPAVLHTTFSNDLDGLPGEFILVLDDYHAIRGMEIPDLLNKWSQHWPKPLHLVLISRTNPSMPLASLRAKGLLSELHTRDLRFTPQETTAFLNQAQLTRLSQPDLLLLEERFEGWPAGLHLAAITLRSADNQEAILSCLSGENADITGYLVNEVLSRLPPPVHAFLLRTSVLQRLSVPLCDAVIGEADPTWEARACLDWIERSELFITPLDNRREWYRYHHLFQGLLQQRLSAGMAADQVSDLHRRASTWFEAQGLIDEALSHALAAGDLELTARQMSIGLRWALNHEDRPSLERWLRLLPEEMMQQNPWLLMIKSYTLQFTWRLDSQIQVIQQIEGLLDTETGASLSADDLQLLRGLIHLLRAQQAYFNNQTALAIDLCRKVLAFMPSEWIFVRGGAMIYLSLSLQANGQSMKAEKILLSEYESYSEKNDVYGLLILQSLCFIHFNTGQLEKVTQIAQILLQRAIGSSLGLMQFWAKWFLGSASYQHNELEAAEQNFSRIIENQYVAHGSPFHDAASTLALIHQFRGEDSEAWRKVESISQHDIEQRGGEDLRTQALRALLLLLQGDLDGAGQWADSFSELPPDQPLIWLIEPQVIRARILLARGAGADLSLALQILDVLEEMAGRTHNTRYMIELLALRAIALEARGEEGAAEAFLKQALDLAQPGGFMRVFVDLGRPMRAMLGRLAKQNYSVKAIQKILTAFPEGDTHQSGSQSLYEPARRATAGSPALAEPLTPRELEILHLLRGLATSKVIALKLNISYMTVKRHIANIYRKLGVNQRWNAVAKAEELNLLPPR